MFDVHEVPTPCITSEQATYIEVHGSLAQLDLIAQIVAQLAHGVVAVPTVDSCTEPNANGCHRLEVVIAGWLDPAQIGAVYQAAVAIHN